MTRNFIIVGTQRTGSTVLFNSLNFHPAIACGGEWTQYVSCYKKLAVTERALAADFSVLTPDSKKQIGKEYHPMVDWLGFKVLFRSTEKWLVHPRFSLALWLDQIENYLRWLSRHPEIRVIHIVRNDAVDWLKSRYLSRKTGMFSFRSYPEGIKVEISLQGAIKQLRSKTWVDTRLASSANTNPYFRVCYEDFMQSKYAVIRQLMEFLECDPAQIGEVDYGGLIKQSKGQAHDYISNYDELVAELHERGFISNRS